MTSVTKSIKQRGWKDNNLKDYIWNISWMKCMGLYNWFLMFQRDPRNLNHSLGNMLILKILEAPTTFLEIAPCDLKWIEGTSSWMEEAWQQQLSYPYYSISEQNKIIGSSVTLQYLIGRNNHNQCLDWYWSGLGD